MKFNNLLITGLLIIMTGCASNVDYFYPNTGLQSDEVDKMSYAEIISLGEKAYQDKFYSESSRLFMTARLIADDQNIVDKSILEANSKKEFQSMVKDQEQKLQTAIARYGDTHAEVADKEFWLAKAHINLDQHEQAKIHIKRAIEIGEIVLSPNSYDLKNYYSFMDMLNQGVL